MSSSSSSSANSAGGNWNLPFFCNDPLCMAIDILKEMFVRSKKQVTPGANKPSVSKSSSPSVAQAVAAIDNVPVDMRRGRFYILPTPLQPVAIVKRPPSGRLVKTAGKSTRITLNGLEVSKCPPEKPFSDSDSCSRKDSTPMIHSSDVALSAFARPIISAASNSRKEFPSVSFVPSAARSSSRMTGTGIVDGSCKEPDTRKKRGRTSS
eukprot:gene13733-29207_t